MSDYKSPFTVEQHRATLKTLEEHLQYAEKIYAMTVKASSRTWTYARFAIAPLREHIEEFRQTLDQMEQTASLDLRTMNDRDFDYHLDHAVFNGCSLDEAKALLAEAKRREVPLQQADIVALTAPSLDDFELIAAVVSLDNRVGWDRGWNFDYRAEVLRRWPTYQAVLAIFEYELRAGGISSESPLPPRDWWELFEAAKTAESIR